MAKGDLYTYKGETKNARQWFFSEKPPVDQRTFHQRLKNGMTIEEAILTPNLKPKHKDCIVENQSDVKSSHSRLIGKKFGRLLVLDKCLKCSDSGFVVYKCKCDCGKSAIISKFNLLKGKTKSCGCLCKEINSENGKKTSLGNGVACQNYIFYSYRQRAKVLGKIWELTKDEFLNLSSKNCYYCGTLPNMNTKGGKTFTGSFLRNGIDRKNNNLGYTIKNSVSCCETCNKSKIDYDYFEFVNKIEEIYNYYKTNRFLDLNGKYSPDESEIGGARVLWNNYHSSAKRRAIEWNLNKDLFFYMTRLPCFYCGCKNSTTRKSQKKDKSFYTSNGLDRKSIKTGYNPESVLPCCSICNYLKRKLNLEDFISHVHKIYNHLIKPNLVNCFAIVGEKTE